MDAFPFGQFNFQLSPADRPFEIVLDGRNDVGLVPVVLILQLFSDRLNAKLHVGLLSIDQDPEVIVVLRLRGDYLVQSLEELCYLFLLLAGELKERFHDQIIVFFRLVDEVWVVLNSEVDFLYSKLTHFTRITVDLL